MISEVPRNISGKFYNQSNCLNALHVSLKHQNKDSFEAKLPAISRFELFVFWIVNNKIGYIFFEKDLLYLIKTK